jgi:transcriptional regulator with XRE-family HTH domain
MKWCIIDSMDRNFNNLGTWLPPLIEKTGMSYEQFARAVGRTRVMIYNYIKDINRPDEQTMIRMCQVLGVPVEEGMGQYTPRKVGRPLGLK